MAGRKKSDYPIKNKRLSIRISENDVLRLKNISEKYNLVYLDIIRKGIECINEGKNIPYSISSGIKNKNIYIKVTEEEFLKIKSLLKQYSLTYFDAIMIGLKYLENKK